MIYWSGSGLKIEHLNIFLCEIAEVFKYTLFVIIVVNMEKKIRPGGGVLLGILGEGVPPDSPNPEPILDQKMPFSSPFFKPDL